MMKTRILFYIACLLLGVWTTTCSDDAFDEYVTPQYGVDKNCMLKVHIPFQTTRGMSAHIVTRAGGTVDQFGKDSQVSGIMAYVFENNGGAPENDKRLNWQLFGMPNMTVEGETDKLIIPDSLDLTKGYFDLYIPKGNVYIYLIGNAKGSFVDFFGSIGTNQLTNRRDFLDLVRPTWIGNLYAVDGYMPMCGMVNNNSGACTVEVDPTNPKLGILKYTDYDGRVQVIDHTFGTSSSFVLKRLMSKVSMEFKEGPNVKFTPRNFRFYHCAKQVAPVVDLNGYAIHAGAKFDPPTVDTDRIPFSAQTPMSFMAYLPENVREYTGQKVLTFADRDKVRKTNSNQNIYETQEGHRQHYDFENAPPKSTYVEVTGHLENTVSKQTADVRYLIHLGDFSKATDPHRFHHFSLRRDWYYRYTVTVNGVEDIKVEVNSTNGEERNPAVEGVVFEGGARLRLDAHYEQVEMKFTRAQLDKGVYIYAKTPFGLVNCKYLPASRQLDPTHSNTPATIQDAQKVLQWLSFRKQSGKGVLALYNNRSHQDQTPVKNVFEALDEAYAATGNESYYTCFVDEYYYDKNPVTGGATDLQDFINADDRIFSLGSDIHYSLDGQSAVSHTLYMLEQRSIACFYDLNNHALAKYGMEQVDEIADLLNQSRLPYGTPAAESAEPKYGRSNTLKEIGTNTDVVDWTKNGFLLDANDQELVPGPNRLKRKEAHLACLTRNRDFDGNGRIENDELRWYTPARDQMLGLWIGEPAMPAEAAIFPHSTTDLVRPTAGSAYPIFTSTNGDSRVIYAEEGSTFGNIKSAAGGGYIHAVRNLGKIPSPQSHLTPPESFYKWDVKTRTVELYLTPNALRAYSTRELAPHHERSVINRPYRKFQIAAHPYVKPKTVECQHWNIYKMNYNQLQVTNAQSAKNAATTLAANYKEKGDKPGEATWRLPNQREMALMIVVMGTSGAYHMDDYIHTNYSCGGFSWGGKHLWKSSDNYVLHCRTSFSNKNYTPFGYMYNTHPDEGKMQMIWTGDNRYGMGNDGTAGYFCVRDVK